MFSISLFFLGPNILLGRSYAPGVLLLVTIYNITSSTRYAGPATLVSGAQCDGRGDGCAISAGTSYSVTITINIGGYLHLNLGDIVTAGITGGISIAHSTATSITTTESCPPGAQCGLIATAQLYHVVGYKNAYYPPPSNHNAGNVAELYDVSIPVMLPGAQGNSAPVIEYGICTLPGTMGVPGSSFVRRIRDGEGSVSENGERGL